MLAKAIANPRKIPPYLHRRLFRTDPIERPGVVTFEEGGFVSSPADRPEFSSKLYREVADIRAILSEHVRPSTIERALEIGCGYGRLSPWLTEFSTRVVGVDVNAAPLAKAQYLHPEVDFNAASVDALPFRDDSFGFALSWTVLMHVPPETIERACAELSRCLADGGYLLLAENSMRANDGPTVWGRTPETYASLLGMELVEIRGKPVERTYGTDEALRTTEQRLALLSA